MASKKKTGKGKDEPVSFEKSLEELEEIVRRLDAEDLGVEEAMAEYEKGLDALKRCRKILDEAEKKLEVLVKEEDGEAETRAFDAGAGGEGGEPAPKGKGKGKKEKRQESKDGFLF